MKKPVVELSECVVCEVCIDICPKVFSMNDAGFIQVNELDDYDLECVEDAVKNCPSDCIEFTEE